MISTSEKLPTIIQLGLPLVFGFAVLFALILIEPRPPQKAVDRCIKICDNNEMVFEAVEGMNCLCREPEYYTFSME